MAGPARAGNAEDTARSESGFRLRGFVEARGGVWEDRDPRQQHAALSESRLQLEADRRVMLASFRIAADLLYDPLADGPAIDLAKGTGALDLREAHATFSPAAFLDVRFGRQILTWGTGDLLFVNDLFPKDWNSFLLGRGEQYLKAPSDALKISAFSEVVNLDLIYVPRFGADRFVDGRRLSYFNAAQGRIAGRDAVMQEDRPNAWGDDEWAIRISRNFEAVEGALYAYDGFWKSPAGSDSHSGRATFPRLSAFGGSLRGPLAGGIASGEFGYYHSGQDAAGTDPNVRNSEVRALVGYEREVAPEVILGLQYYLEHMRHHNAYEASLPARARARDENRHLLAERLTWLTLSQTLEWSLFTFVSPTDKDVHFRPRVKYKVDDHITLEAGANIFLGENTHTFFGQFKDGNNVYASVRYGF
ncbi:MAG: hypothetical protein HZC25_02755 [Rhodospirillales bacterium]|nr:hypothetical protein [Rhodospirillales bacterium]